MFEKFTEKAKRVLFFARYEASQLGSVSIEPEHLLLGLMREDKGLPNKFVLHPTLSLDSIRKEIEARIPPSAKVATSIDLPFSQGSIHVLNFASAEAESLSHKYIGTEHILLGLLREETSPAAEILRQKALELAVVRQKIQVPEFRRQMDFTSVRLSYSDESIRVLNFAREEAVRLSHPRITPEHILLGLLEEGKSRAAELLRQKSLDFSTVRESLTGPPLIKESSTEVPSLDLAKISVLPLTEDDKKFLRQLKISSSPFP